MGKNGKNGYDNEALAIYFNEIKNIPVLTFNEERMYGKRKDEGDLEARKKFIESNLKFVVSIAKKYAAFGYPLEDLIEDGNIGLITAVEKFDYLKGYRFTTYATWWINQSISRAITTKYRTIRLPTRKSEEFTKLIKEKNELENKGREFNLEHISKNLNIPYEKALDLWNSGQFLISLEDETNSLKEMLYDEKSDVEKEAIYNFLKRDIDFVLETLSDTEADILKLRFGLNGNFPMTLERIGKLYRKSPETIRCIEGRAIKKIRNSFRVQCLEDYVR